ncbi:MAG: prepilin-type N-terminal cleavage/methylation domain-containing protein [Elusimicrobiota bacterium]
MGKNYIDQICRNAFTLIELLIVILIISTLASISAPMYFKIIERFRVVEATTNMMEIKKGQERVILKKSVYTDNFRDFDFEIKDINGKNCDGKICELKYFVLQIQLIEHDKYMILAQRKSNDKTRPPQAYSPNYIYFYDSRANNFGCTDANCARDFLD